MQTTTRSKIIGVTLFLAALHGAALTVRAQSTLGEARLLRAENRAEKPGPASLLMATTDGNQPAAPAWKPSFMLGAAYTDLDAGGRAWNFPFELDLSDGANTVTFQSDGYASVKGPDAASGFSDVLVLFKHKWKLVETGQAVTLSAGATIPVGGDVGSTRTQERVTAKYSFAPRDDVNVSFSGSLRHSESATANANPYSQVLAFQAARIITDTKDYFVQLVAAHPNGKSWSSTVVVGGDFPISARYSVTLSLARGLNKGHRDTAVEIDLNW